jgi:hypothetical protein
MSYLDTPRIHFLGLNRDQQPITQLVGVVVTLNLSSGPGVVSGRMAVAELRDILFQRVAYTPGAQGATNQAWTKHDSQRGENNA